MRERRVSVHFPHGHRIDVVRVEDDARVGAHRFDGGIECREQTSGTVQRRYHERTEVRELRAVGSATSATRVSAERS